MKPALLNSIYYKLSEAESKEGLQNIAALYAKKVYILYLDALDKAGVNNLHRKIKVKTKFPDGYVLESTYQAGEHIIESLFESDEFSREIKELDDMFLNSCECENKNIALNFLKIILKDVGSDSLDMNDWLEAIKNFSNCEEFLEENDVLFEF